MQQPFPARRWISFLRKYGPVPANDNMYDESIQRSLKKLDIVPIELPSTHVKPIIDNFRSEKPRSVILAGTAGDGKTYTCREVFEQLGGDAEKWNQGDMIQRLTIEGRNYIIVKDLSELPEDKRSEFVPVLAKDVMEEQSGNIYLIAANHGQLLEQINASIDHDFVSELKELVEEIMVSGDNSDQQPLVLYDLSKASAIDRLNNVIDQVVSHSEWSACEDCPLNNSAPRCPIQENRSRLLVGENDQLIRYRLRSLVALSELNDTHYPIRQLLALVANMLLGHPDATDGLMTCKTAARVLDSGTADRASVYSNVFGENLKSRADKTELFMKLRSFGIGEETNNAIDSILVYGQDDQKLSKQFSDLMMVDTCYGATPAFLAAQKAYLEVADAETTNEFLRLLKWARQRLFFVIPEEPDVESLLWELTVFRFSGEFLSTAESLKKEGRANRRVLSKIVKGLNRVFTGALLEDDQQVVLASAGSHSQSRTSHIVDAVVSVPHRLGEEVTLGWEKEKLELLIHLAPIDKMDPIRLPLTLLRFEFLFRVAEGALPSSFSRECYEDLLDYKVRLFRALQKRDSSNKREEDREIVINFLEVGEDGRVRQEPVGVKLR